MRRPLATVVATVAVLGGVGHAAAAQETQQAPPEITIQRPGSGPRAALRYTLPVGTVQRSVVTINTSVSQRVGSTRRSGTSPQIALDATATVTGAAPDGSITVTFAITAGRVEKGAPGADQVRAAVRALVGFAITLVLDDRGEVRSASGPPPAGLDDTAAQLLQQFVSQARSLTVPLPEEAVGTGARWAATADATINGIHLRQAARYRLVRRQGQRVELAIEISQRAPQQTFTDPASGSKVRLLSSRAEGSGTATLELGQPLPRASDTRVQVQQRLRSGGRLISTSLRINARLEPGRAS